MLALVMFLTSFDFQPREGFAVSGARRSSSRTPDCVGCVSSDSVCQRQLAQRLVDPTINTVFKAIGRKLLAFDIVARHNSHTFNPPEALSFTDLERRVAGTAITTRLFFLAKG